MNLALAGWGVVAVGCWCALASSACPPESVTRAIAEFTAAEFDTSDSDESEVDVRSLLPRQWLWAHDLQGAVCGVYALCRALGQWGIDVDPMDLWTSSVVGQRQGSTPGELITVIEKYGGRADLRQHLSILELQSVGAPVIANVRGAPDRNVYDHWVCVQAGDQGLILFDGADAGRVIDPAEFLASFSGVGIVVSRTAQSRYQTTLARLLGIAAVLGIGWLVLMVGDVNGERLLRQTIRIGLATAALAAAGLWVFDTANGFDKGRRMALAPFVGAAYRTGGMRDLQGAIQNPGSLLVDARTPDSVAYGTLKGAVNIPVFATYYEIRDLHSGFGSRYANRGILPKRPLWLR